MRKTMFILAAAVAAAFATTATAAPTKGKPPTTGTACKPAIAVILKGTLTANGAAAPSSLSVTVSGGNHASAWKKLAQPVAIAITATTKVNRNGDSNPANLKSGDRVVIQGRACKAETGGAALPASLSVVRVTAHPAH